MKQIAYKKYLNMKNIILSIFKKIVHDEKYFSTPNKSDVKP